MWVKSFDNGFYTKIIVEFIDKSKLFISEYLDENERNYSYHWQDKNNDLIVRWDNAPYHKNIDTFPHHLHRKNEVFENYHITFAEILLEIENQISKPRRF